MTREFQLGPYWLGQRENSPAFYRCWREGRRTRRASLGTTDFEIAKERLTDFFVDNRKPKDEKPGDVPLADVLRRYYVEHASKLRTAHTVKVGINQWLDHWSDAPVSDLSDITRQEAFHQYLRDRGMKESSVLRVIGMGKAAINRALKRGQLREAPYILTVSAGAQEPMGRPMELEEVKALYSKANPHLRIFIAWMLGTAARPEAILDLHSRQVDRRHKLVALCPPERPQNKKYRPTVKLIPYLVDCDFEGFLVVDKSRHVRSIKNSWKAARIAAGLDARVTPYSLRHTAARWMRSQKVSEWDVSTQLGHKRPGTTETYTAFDPGYLKGAAKALDKLVRATCAPLPVRRKYVAIRNKKEIQRDTW